uniref:Lipase n=1 Tax=Acrobeloides nanus TaxID=290746 RepID=A0A914C6G9_9BILA
MHFSVIFLFSFYYKVYSQQGANPRGPLTDDFQTWLINNGFEEDGFERPDIGPAGSFGGKSHPGEKIVNEPVIFIHGNGDAALYLHDPIATGWTRSVKYFLEQNYSNAELYTTTWGDTWGTGNVIDTYSTIHTCSYVVTIRRFIEAVIAYTKAPKVDIIAHSVGVPFARKAIKGGHIVATDGKCDIGKPITQFVDTFLGIAGPNFGLCLCQLAQTVPAWCNALDGLYPGYTCGDQMLCGYPGEPCEQKNYSAFLEQLNKDETREGDHVYAMWSDVDEVLLMKSMTWGKPTARIPRMNGRWVSDRNSHVAMKDLTELRQYEAVVHHSI